MDSATEKKIEVKDNNVEEIKEPGIQPIREDIKEPEVQAVKVDPELQNTLVKAFQANKYFICITRLEGDKLSHDTFTREFKKGDIAPTLDAWADAMTKEME